MTTATKQQLIELAERYETADFLIGDPSWYMHQVTGCENQETMAFIASCISYGSRKQFMPKIGQILEWSAGEPYRWVKEGHFNRHLCSDDSCCFYRLYTCACMHQFLAAYQQMLLQFGTMGDYVRQHAHDGLSAVESICRWFATPPSTPSLTPILTPASITTPHTSYLIHHTSYTTSVVPKDTTSACKRVCMFLRWMVRDHSPVDLGLWADFIDRRTLIMPLDTHVLTESKRLGLTSSRTASMSAAIKLTNTLAEIFPDDPLRGDFALFGFGVNNN